MWVRAPRRTHSQAVRRCPAGHLAVAGDPTPDDDERVPNATGSLTGRARSAGARPRRATVGGSGRAPICADPPPHPARRADLVSGQVPRQRRSTMLPAISPRRPYPVVPSETPGKVTCMNAKSDPPATSQAVSRRERRAAERAARRGGAPVRSTTTARRGPSVLVISVAAIIIGFVVIAALIGISGGLGATARPWPPCSRSGHRAAGPGAAAGRSLGDPSAPSGSRSSKTSSAQPAASTRSASSRSSSLQEAR